MPAPSIRFVLDGFTHAHHADGRTTRGYRVDPARVADGVFTDALGVRMPVVTRDAAIASGWVAAPEEREPAYASDREMYRAEQGAW